MDPKRGGVPTIEERLQAWKELDAAAKAAEDKLRAVGQAGPSPEYRDLVLQAKLLRDHADREFSAITRAVHLDGPGSP